ncbi:MAG: radical SAM protein [Nitrospinae bacterium]|nr:radical SAM protein [Nitrospinota bacterium]
MNILFISANRARTPLPVMPAGACLAAEAAAAAGHHVTMLDLMFGENPDRALDNAIAQSSPGAVCISLRNIDNNAMAAPVSYIDFLPGMVQTIRKLSPAPVIIGGAAVGVMPEELLRRGGADFAITGDAGDGFTGLLGLIESGGDGAKTPSVLPGSTGPCNGTAVIPDFGRWVNVSRYRAAMASVPVRTKSGCGFGCAYCTYGAINGKKVNIRGPEEVARAIEKCIARGFRDFEFVDDVFNFPKEHAIAVCRAIAPLRRRARFQCLELNPLFLDGELLMEMERAGFNAIGVTVESASDAVLRGLNKGYGAKEVREAARVVARHGMRCMWLFMLGGPGETEETARQTLAFAEDAVRPGDLAYVTCGIRLYPGTPLEKTARAEGLLTATPEEMLEPVFYRSPAVPLPAMLAMVEDAARRNPHFHIAGERLPRFAPQLLKIGGMLGLRPPLWRYSPMMKRGLSALGLRP